MEWLVELAAPVQWLILFGLLLCVGAISRGLAKRRAHLEHFEEQAKHADAVSGPVAASLALLIGFAITITWGGVSAAQTATEAEAVAARQIGWSIILNTGEMSANLPEAEAKQTLRDLVSLLNATSAPNAQSLASTKTERDPVDTALRSFQQSVRQLTYNPRVEPAQSESIQSAADAVASAEADTNAIAQRRLPSLFIVLILVTATLLAALQGFGLVNKPRPWAALAWAGVVALSITVVLQMDSPFAGDISVDRQSLSNVAAWLSAN